MDHGLWSEVPHIWGLNMEHMSVSWRFHGREEIALILMVHVSHSHPFGGVQSSACVVNCKGPDIKNVSWSLFFPLCIGGSYGYTPCMPTHRPKSTTSELQSGDLFWLIWMQKTGGENRGCLILFLFCLSISVSKFVFLKLNRKIIFFPKK